MKLTSSCFCTQRIEKIGCDKVKILSKINSSEAKRITDQLANRYDIPSLRYGDSLYFKGDSNYVYDILNKFNVEYECYDEPYYLSLSNNWRIIVELLNRIFEILLKNRNIIRINRYQFMIKDYVLGRLNDIDAIMGFEFKFEYFNGDRIRIWIDPHIIPMRENHRVSYEEIAHNETITQRLKNLSQPTPSNRYKYLQEILKFLGLKHNDKYIIQLNFPDNDTIDFYGPYEVSPVRRKDILQYKIPQDIFYESLTEPLLRFRNGVAENPRRILTYKALTYGELKRIKLKVLYFKNLENLVNAFINDLCEGYSDYEGFERIFGSTLEVEKEPIIDNVDEVCSTISAYVNKNYIVTLCANESFLKRNYGRLKASAFVESLKGYNMKLQLIGEETLHKQDRGRIFTLLNIAVSIFSRAGGVPWHIVRSDGEPIMPQGLFIGITFSKPLQKVSLASCGVVSIFDRWGRLIEINTVPISLRRPLLIPPRNLRMIMTKFIKQYNPRRIIVYKTPNYNPDEISTFQGIARERGISIILIHLMISTRVYRYYDLSDPEYMASRGMAIYELPLCRSTILTTGRFRKRRPLGTPRPIILRLVSLFKRNGEEISLSDYELYSTLKDLSEKTYALTKAYHCTTELMVREPATIKYSRKIADIVPFLPRIMSTLT